MAVTADYDAQTAVERELVLRLASLLWRLRRATAIESGLFEFQAQRLLQFQQQRQAHQARQKTIDNMYRLGSSPGGVRETLKTTNARSGQTTIHSIVLEVRSKRTT